MSWIWILVAFLAGLASGIILGVVVDKDYFYKIGKIKTRGKGNRVDLDLGDLPPGIKKRHIKRLQRLKNKVGK